MKKLLAPLGLAASLFALPACAGEILIGATGFNGTLVTDFTQKFATFGGFTPTEFAVSAEDSQLGGGIYFGYVWNVNSGFNINIEGYYDFINVTVDQSVLSLQPLTHEINGIGGLRVLPAFKITNNTEIFIELGWAYISQTFTDPNPLKSSIKENTSGFRYGAGVDTMIYENISLRVFYSVIDQIAEQSLNHDEDGKLTAQPNFNEFGVGVAYHFQL